MAEVKNTPQNIPPHRRMKCRRILRYPKSTLSPALFRANESTWKELYKALADKAARESEVLGRQASKMLDAIPPGQPLLVNHHLYNSDKRYREHIWNKTEKSVEAAKKSDYYAAKAEAVERNTAIFSDDPQALEKLKEKLEDQEDSHAFMKQVNAYYRLHKTGLRAKMHLWGLEPRSQ